MMKMVTMLLALHGSDRVQCSSPQMEAQTHNQGSNQN